MKDNLNENWITCAIDTDYVKRVFKIGGSYEINRYSRNDE